MGCFGDPNCLQDCETQRFERFGADEEAARIMSPLDMCSRLLLSEKLQYTEAKQA
jgi:hypothetical protein